MEKKLERLPPILGQEKTEELSDLCSDSDVAQFPVKFTSYQAGLLKKAPELGKVFLPERWEVGSFGETQNNYGESENRVLGFKGGQNKYPPTLLLTVWDDCVANCRFCFRRYTAREDKEITGEDEYQSVFDYVRGNPKITNVLLSGGDPLVMPRGRLEKLLGGLSEIESLKYIRIGTKVVADNPQMVNQKLAQMLGRYSSAKTIYIVNQFNHPVELTEEAGDATQLLREQGLVLRNQHPILRGVNDDAGKIEELYSGLAGFGITPYYAFQLMPVKGTTELETVMEDTYFMLERAKRNLDGQAKSFRYILPSRTGKIEIVGFDREDNPSVIFLKYHEAKNPHQHTNVFSRPYQKGTTWIDI